MVILFGFGILHITTPDKKVDKDERRYLDTLPKITMESIKNGKYYDDFENYMLDQAPFRAEFREIKSLVNYNVFMKKENEDIIVKDGIAIKLNFDYSYNNVLETTSKLQVVKNTIVPNNKTYFALVPDKNCYLQEGIDYNKVLGSIKINNVTNINLYNELELTKYYKTDTHWNQEKIIDVANYILEQMGITTRDVSYNAVDCGEFKGILSSQASLSKTDKLEYLTNDMLENCTVFNYETNKEGKIYDVDKLTDEKSLDAYDMFLSGSVPLVRIDNPSVDNDKTLIIFRDSFGSSITPLFTPYYYSIYVVDLRYLNSSIINKMITINGDEDVLFLYSTTIMETPGNFKVG